MSELDELMCAFGEAGVDRGVLADKETAHLAAGGHKILSMRGIEGLEVKARETFSGIDAKITVKRGVKIKNPVHMCFGVLHKKGTQKIKMRVKLEEDSSAQFVAHCLFPKAEKGRHIMDAVVGMREGAEMKYSEVHYHGPYGGIKVIPRLVVNVGKNGRYYTDFTLVNGRVGKLDIDYSVTAGGNTGAGRFAHGFVHV